MAKESLQRWAEEESEGVQLDHSARAAGATQVLANLARGSGSRVTDFTKTSAERQQAYGFMENDKVVRKAPSEAAALAALRRAGESRGRCLVAVDGSSLHFSDGFRSKGFGQVVTRASTGGLLVQSALALSEDGVPLGLLAQEFRARTVPAPKGRKAARRPVDEKETRYWLEVIATAEAAGVDAGIDGNLWFQIDRGYDCATILELMAESLNRFVVRGAYNRALWRGEKATDGDLTDGRDNEVHRHIQDALDASAIVSTLELVLEESSTNTARTAKLELQVARVEVRLTVVSRRHRRVEADGKRRTREETRPRTLTVVRVRETGTVPTGEKAIQWMLWVNFEVTTEAEARLVVSNYSFRWRIEDFHRVWKSGALGVETTQARSRDNVERIARMSALVACRILRLTLRARSEPDAPADTEFSDVEIVVLTQMDPRSPKQKPRPERSETLAWAMAIIADFVGYTGKSSGGPPGPLVIARGFQRLQERVEGFAIVLEMLRANRDQW